MQRIVGVGVKDQRVECRRHVVLRGKTLERFVSFRIDDHLVNGQIGVGPTSDPLAKCFDVKHVTGGGGEFVVIDVRLLGKLAGDINRYGNRLRSSGFNPQALVGGDDPLTALKKLLAHLLTVSGAPALPDRESVLGQPFRSYRSLLEYQHSTFQTAPATG